MSFWDLSDNTSATEDVQKEYEIPGGNMEPIPNNSDCLAHIKAVKWASKRDADEKYIEIQWQVEKPAEYLNRVVFQKLWVDDLDPMAKSEDKAKEKRDKARRMLATIDANAKGKLMQSGDAPTDDSLALALQGALAVLKVMLWEMPDREQPGEYIRGNWVAGVSPKTKEVSIGETAPKAKAAHQKPPANSFDLDGDSIPF